MTLRDYCTNDSTDFIFVIGSFLLPNRNKCQSQAIKIQTARDSYVFGSCPSILILPTTIFYARYVLLSNIRICLVKEKQVHLCYSDQHFTVPIKLINFAIKLYKVVFFLFVRMFKLNVSGQRPHAFTVCENCFIFLILEPMSPLCVGAAIATPAARAQDRRAVCPRACALPSHCALAFPCTEYTRYCDPSKNM